MLADKIQIQKQQTKASLCLLLLLWYVRGLPCFGVPCCLVCNEGHSRLFWCSVPIHLLTVALALFLEDHLLYLPACLLEDVYKMKRVPTPSPYWLSSSSCSTTKVYTELLSFLCNLLSEATCSPYFLGNSACSVNRRR